VKLFFEWIDRFNLDPKIKIFPGGSFELILYALETKKVDEDSLWTIIKEWMDDRSRFGKSPRAYRKFTFMISTNIDDLDELRQAAPLVILKTNASFNKYMGDLDFGIVVESKEEIIKIVTKCWKNIQNYIKRILKEYNVKDELIKIDNSSFLNLTDLKRYTINEDVISHIKELKLLVAKNMPFFEFMIMKGKPEEFKFNINLVFGSEIIKKIYLSKFKKRLSNLLREKIYSFQDNAFTGIGGKYLVDLNFIRKLATNLGNENIFQKKIQDYKSKIFEGLNILIIYLEKEKRDLIGNPNEKKSANLNLMVKIVIKHLKEISKNSKIDYNEIDIYLNSLTKINNAFI
jgi:hypothetical protein